MVYRGKPGLGCDLCRERRLTCDRRRPSCSQCIRIRRECTGYRDPNTLRIFDQTEEISQKVRARRSASRQTTPTSSEKSVTPPARLVSPPISLDDHIMSHIFTFWVGSTQIPGTLWHLPGLLAKDPSPALQASVRALGLGSMSGMQDSTPFARSAAESYGVALSVTNEALRDPAVATSDSTLTAVTILGTYEMIMSKMGKHSMHGWMNHILGATRMLELRGEEQINSELGLFLFENVTLLNAISGVIFRYSKHHSPKIWELSEMVEAKSNESTKSRQRFFRIIVRLNDLSIKLDKTEKSPENLETLLREALHFEADLKSWASSLDQSWHYTVINTISSSSNENPCSATGRQSQHRYHDAGIAGLWNFYRQMRIIVNDMIRFICQHILNFEWSHECEQIMFQSSAVIDQLVDDICASIDFYFVYGPPGISAVLRLQLPLFVAAVCTAKYSERYMWIMEKLEMLSTLTGFEQTISLAHRLKEGQIYGIIPSK